MIRDSLNSVYRRGVIEPRDPTSKAKKADIPKYKIYIPRLYKDERQKYNDILDDDIRVWDWQNGSIITWKKD